MARRHRRTRSLRPRRARRHRCGLDRGPRDDVCRVPPTRRRPTPTTRPSTASSTASTIGSTLHRLRRVPRLLMRLGISDRDAWLVAGTLSMEAAWCVASLLAVCFALVASSAASSVASLAVFLVVAPLVPLAGIAISFGRRVDPTFEVAQACPTPAMRILLVRAVAILGVTIPVLACRVGVLHGSAGLRLAAAGVRHGDGNARRRHVRAADSRRRGVRCALGDRRATSPSRTPPAPPPKRSPAAYVMFRGTGQVLSVVLIVVVDRRAHHPPLQLRGEPMSTYIPIC